MSPDGTIAENIIHRLKTFDSLVDLVGGRIYTYVPKDTDGYPFIYYWPLTTIISDTQTSIGHDVFIDIIACSRTEGIRETLAILDIAEGAIHNWHMDLEGHSNVITRFTRRNVLASNEGHGFHGVSTFKITTVKQ